MMNIFITWQVGYFARVQDYKLSLRKSRIHFYNETGVVLCCDLMDTANFLISVNCPFNFRNKENFTRNEVFAIKHKGGTYSLYIPASEVGLVKGGTITKKHPKDLARTQFTRWSFLGRHLSFHNSTCNTDNFESKNGRIFFKVYNKTIVTKKGKDITNLCEEIRETCFVRLDEYDLASILEHYNITKK